MKLPRLKDLVREQARFVKFQDGNLWYQVICTTPEEVISEVTGRPYTEDAVLLFDFPIPVHDTDGGTFLNSDRAMIFMRWMRKHLAYLEASMTELSEGHA